MKYLYLLLLLVCFATPAIAQPSYKGYVVSGAGDTLHGSFFGYVPARYNPDRIAFTDNSGQKQTITPNNCRAFAVDGYDVYVARHCSRMINSMELDDFTETNTGERFEENDVFLRLLFNANGFLLYEYSGSDRKNYFFESGQDTLTELKFRMYRDGNRLVELRDYRMQLQRLFGTRLVGNTGLQYKLERLGYSRLSLVSFFENTTGVKAKTTIPHKRYPLKMSVIAGANWYKAKGYNDVVPDEEMVVSPLLGVSFQYSFNNPAYFYSTELAFSTIRSTGANPYQFSGAASNKYETRARRFDARFMIGQQLVQKSKFVFYTAEAVQISLISQHIKNVYYYGDSKEWYIPWNLHLRAGVSYDRLGVWAGVDVIKKELAYGLKSRPIQAGVRWNFFL